MVVTQMYTIVKIHQTEQLRPVHFIIYIYTYIYNVLIKKYIFRNFPGGPVVKNPPSNAGDAGSIPGRGAKIPHAAGQLTRAPQLLIPRTLDHAHHN